MFVLYLCGIMVVCENQTKSSNNNLSGALNTNFKLLLHFSLCQKHEHGAFGASQL